MSMQLLKLSASPLWVVEAIVRVEYLLSLFTLKETVWREYESMCKNWTTVLDTVLAQNIYNQSLFYISVLSRNSNCISCINECQSNLTSLLGSSQ